MAKRVQLRRGTTPQTSIFTGAVGEVTVDTDKKTIVVHDGVTAGGFPNAARANADGTISLIKKDGASAGVINATGLFNDTLTSTATNQALTANMGKSLDDKLLGQVGTTYTTSGIALNTIYTNTSARPLLVFIVATVATAGTTLQIQSGSGSVLGWSGSAPAGGKVVAVALIKAGGLFKYVQVGAGTVTIDAQIWSN